jgi:transposase
MKRTQCSAEFKAEAVKQIIEKGHPAPELSSRLGVPVGLLYT